MTEPGGKRVYTVSNTSVKLCCCFLNSLVAWRCVLLEIVQLFYTAPLKTHSFKVWSLTPACWVACVACLRLKCSPSACCMSEFLFDKLIKGIEWLWLYRAEFLFDWGHRMTLSIQGRVSVKLRSQDDFEYTGQSFCILRTQNDFEYTRQSFCNTEDAEWLWLYKAEFL